MSRRRQQETPLRDQAPVKAAEDAFPAWRDTSILRRQQIMFNFVRLIRENWDRLAASITLEQGKTLADARGDGCAPGSLARFSRLLKIWRRAAIENHLALWPLYVPSVCLIAKEAGFPEGVINIIHGTHRPVNFIIDEPAIKAISFVGGNAAGEYIYSQGSANGKRVQANLGAKNHAVVLPDCNRKSTINAITGAAFGAAGQRCMGLYNVPDFRPL